MGAAGGYAFWDSLRKGEAIVQHEQEKTEALAIASQLIGANPAAAAAPGQEQSLISDRLAKADPGNAGWRRDLSISYSRVGDVLVAQGKLAEALASYQDGLAIRDRLAKADPGNASWQRDLAVSHYKVATIQAQQGDAPGALNEFRALK